MNVHVRDHSLEEFDTRTLLRNAGRQADRRRYEDIMIVDVDSHHYETEHYADILEYMDDPVLRSITRYGSGNNFLGAGGGRYQDLQGRITRYPGRRKEKTPPATPHRDIALATRWMDAMGVDITCMFPTPMLGLGMHPDPHGEVELSRAYNRWLCERILAHEPRIKSMLYLPMNDPAAALKMVKEFGGKKGVIGFMVTTVRDKQLFDNMYMKLYAELEERKLPLAFHSAINWSGDNQFAMTNKFIVAHALGFSWYNILHCTNWVMNGLPERFPGLKTIWIEAGLAWIPFVMQRMDNEFMMRSSEAPSLKKLPSDYMRDMYFSSQPMEQVNNKGMLEQTFKMIAADTQLVYSSDYPHWDMDLPSTIYDLPFLSDGAKRNILGGNASRLFGLEPYIAPAKKAKAEARKGARA